MNELILSLSTATDMISVALHASGQLLCHLKHQQAHSAGEVLPEMVAEVFAKAAQSPSALCAVAIASGPGSYTGLRIGTAFTKGLCCAQNLPLVPINTLEVLCHSAKSFPMAEGQLLYALLDARRSYVYGLLVDHKGSILEGTHVCSISALKTEMVKGHHHLYLVGSGVTYAREMQLDIPHTVIAGDAPLASAMGHLAYKAFQQKAFAADDYEPLYLSALGAYAPKKPKPLV